MGGIGNVVLVTPLIDALRGRYPGARMTVVLRSRGGAEILRAFPDMSVYEFDFAGGAAVRRFARNHRLPRFDLVGRCSVRQTAAAMRHCTLFVGNDSGPMHLAAAVGTPVVAVFGPTDPRKNAPWGDRAHHVVVREDLPCSPCYRPYSGRVVCTNPLHLECLERITVERVLQVVRVIMESIPKP